MLRFRKQKIFGRLAQLVRVSANLPLASLKIYNTLLILWWARAISSVG
ncbi:MAG: hypothetical protein UT28_C0001G0148 [Berkelbacteria bacterium GW2011_GWE1_39_12]|uniref:Uncharacterized protein n=1 Tax=Berkelbacteria bacterium GW2011_GWE1_39_12 TaxID=1618337 RepID=A0A0G4B1X9_9BACT|nr:MAG: hypothetical protein UT28_C0001G0148 [Berkelbacteria bacterium GW2011_GWE1_39_12]